MEMKVVTRDNKENTRALRRNGFIPAVVYGKGIDQKSVKIEEAKFSAQTKGKSGVYLIDLSVDEGQAIPVVIREKKKHPVTGRVTHLDFWKVDMEKEIEVPVKLRFMGEAPAVKALGGILTKVREEAKIIAKPQSIISEIEVDLSSLKDFTDMITLAHLTLPEGVRFADDTGLPVATVSAPRVDKKAAAAAATEEGAAAEGGEAPKAEEGAAEKPADA